MFQKATKTKQKARIALVGPSGSGKTYTSLMLAKTLSQGGPIAVIDSERGSASKYAGDICDFDVASLESFSPDRYVEAMEAAHGYPVLVIDSLSHAWMGKDGALDQVDRRGGKFQAWKEVTPMQQRMIDAILDFPGHVIVTLRSKTEYVVEKEKNGRTSVRKVGLAPVQRDGLEYEFDVVGTMDDKNNLAITKTRCVALSEQVIRKPGAELGETILAWLGDGKDPAQAATDNIVALYAETPDDAGWRAANGRVSKEARRVSFTDAQKEAIRVAKDDAEKRVRGDKAETQKEEE